MAQSEVLVHLRMGFMKLGIVYACEVSYLKREAP